MLLFLNVDSIYEAEPEDDLLSNICCLQQQLSHLPSDASDPCWTHVRVGVNVETRTKTQQTEVEVKERALKAIEAAFCGPRPNFLQS